MYQMCDMVYNIYTKNSIECEELYERLLITIKMSTPYFAEKQDFCKVIVTKMKNSLGVIVEYYIEHVVNCIFDEQKNQKVKPIYIENLLEKEDFDNWIENYINEDDIIIELDDISQIQNEEELIDLF